MAGWRLFQNFHFRRAGRHLSTGSQPSLGKRAPSDCRPEAGCVVIGFGTIVMPSVRECLICAGIGFFRRANSKILWSSQSDLPKRERTAIYERESSTNLESKNRWTRTGTGGMFCFRRKLGENKSLPVAAQFRLIIIHA